MFLKGAAAADGGGSDGCADCSGHPSRMAAALIPARKQTRIFMSMSISQKFLSVFVKIYCTTSAQKPYGYNLKVL